MNELELNLKLNAFIVCRSAQRRSLLQQGMSDEKQFEVVRHNALLEEALKKLDKEKCWHIIFISPEYTKPEIQNFIDESKKIESARDAVFIMLIDWTLDHNDQSNLNTWNEIGFSGFLVAPYTLENLKETTEMATRNFLEKQRKRKRDNILSYLDLLLSQLNLVALNQRTKNPKLEENLIKLRQISRATQSLSSDDSSLFITSLIKLTTEDPNSRRDNAYYGSSFRLRKKYEHMLAKRLMSTNSSAVPLI